MRSSEVHLKYIFFAGRGECVNWNGYQITPTDVKQSYALNNNNIKFGARNAVDENFGTQAGAHTWLKLEFDKRYSILRVIYYYKFYNYWPYDKSDVCFQSTKQFVEECVNKDTGVKVSVYMGEDSVQECGTINLRSGLYQSDQTYEILCYGAVGDTLKLEKSSGVITVYELQVYSSW